MVVTEYLKVSSTEPSKPKLPSISIVTKPVRKLVKQRGYTLNPFQVRACRNAKRSAVRHSKSRDPNERYHTDKCNTGCGCFESCGNLMLI